MTRAMLRRRLRALSHDERGFTILETVIAITVMFASLVALAYTATIGFKSHRVLARAGHVRRGRGPHHGGDPGPGVYEDPNGLVDLGPDRRPEHHQLRRHADRVPVRVVLDGGEDRELRRGCRHPVDQSAFGHGGRGLDQQQRRLHVEHVHHEQRSDDAAVSRHGDRPVGERRLSEQDEQPRQGPEPLRLAAPAASARRRTRSRAPCQPFFYGLAQVPAGKITVTGTVQGLTFSTGYLQTTGTESNLQNEQVTQGRATFAESLASITDGLGTRTEGGVVSGAQAADSDPNAPGATYGTTSEVAGTGGTVSSGERLDLDHVHRRPRATPVVPTSAVAAGGANVCPPPTDLAETDGAPVRGRSDAAGRHAVVDPLAGRHRPGPGLRRRSRAWRRRPATRTSRSSTARRSAARTGGSRSPRRGTSASWGSARSRPASRRPPAFTYLLRMPAGYSGHRDAAGGDDDHGRAVHRNAHGERVVLERRRLHVASRPTAAGLNNLTSTATSAATIAGRAVVVTISVDAGVDRSAGRHAPDEPQRLAPDRCRLERGAVLRHGALRRDGRRRHDGRPADRSPARARS